ncbi:AzlD domain-containing protein, partial [Faecalibaculum rodentium]|uniref:AzlD domain-containing protein n=4 Tax=Faecalibaculum rodentium TaxID=1702221 RepID=UPI003EBFA7AF
WTGAAASSLLSPDVAGACGVAMYGMFIAILIPKARQDHSVAVCIALAATLSLACSLLQMSSGWAVILVTVITAGIMAWLHPDHRTGGKRMTWTEVLPGILTMALVTYLIRALPLALFTRTITSPRIRSFLYYVPYAVLAAMTVPGVFTATPHLASAITGCAAAVLLAWHGKGLLAVSLAAAAAGLLALFIP